MNVRLASHVENGGTCNNIESSFTCTCPIGYTGDVCDIDINKCVTEISCQNGGTYSNYI